MKEGQSHPGRSVSPAPAPSQARDHVSATAVARQVDGGFQIECGKRFAVAGTVRQAGKRAGKLVEEELIRQLEQSTTPVS